MRAPVLTTLRGHTILLEEGRQHGLVLDLGAHQGEFSRLLHGRVGGQFVLVEPNPELARALPAVPAFSSRWAAIADADGQVAFNVAMNPEGSSVLALPAKSDYNILLSERVTVPALRLSTLLSDLGKPRVDVLKMDIEGLESVALLDLSAEALTRIGQATVEFHSDPVFGLTLPVPVDRAIEHMASNGFVWFDFSGGLRRDVLFVNRSWHRLSRFRVARMKARMHVEAVARRAWRGLPKSFRRVARPWVPWSEWTNRG